jgi:hypothetical protein
VRELTQAFAVGATDAAVFSSSIPSDRRLKDDLSGIAPRAVLTTLAGL